MKLENARLAYYLSLKLYRSDDAEYERARSSNKPKFELFFA